MPWAVAGIGMRFIYFVGTAGSGKSTLVQAYKEWLDYNGIDSIIVNLDPGADSTPYTPDIDIREWICLDEVMEEYGLGPNGAQVVASDLMAMNADKLTGALDDFKTKYVLVDTPGQLELFAFRDSSLRIVEALGRDKSMIVYTSDPMLYRSPNGFVSGKMLSTLVQFRLGLPTIDVLTKTDLVSGDTVSQIRGRIDAMIPGIRIIETSSTDLRNISDIIAIVLSDEVSAKAPIAEDNRGFAFEKAKLGWYSGTYDVVPDGDLDMYGLATDLMKGVAAEYGPRSIVHVKVVIESPEAACKMSLVQESMQVDGIFGSRFMRSPGRLVLNARVISPPKRLEGVMRGIMDAAVERYGFRAERTGEKCFMPKPESPSHFLFE